MTERETGGDGAGERFVYSEDDNWLDTTRKVGSENREPLFKVVEVEDVVDAYNIQTTELRTLREERDRPPEKHRCESCKCTLLGAHGRYECDCGRLICRECMHVFDHSEGGAHSTGNPLHVILELGESLGQAELMVSILRADNTELEGERNDALEKMEAALKVDTGPWRTWQSPDENGKPVKVVALTQAKARVESLRADKARLERAIRKLDSETAGEHSLRVFRLSLPLDDAAADSTARPTENDCLCKSPIGPTICPVHPDEKLFRPTEHTETKTQQGE